MYSHNCYFVYWWQLFPSNLVLCTFIMQPDMVKLFQLSVHKFSSTITDCGICIAKVKSCQARSQADVIFYFFFFFKCQPFHHFFIYLSFCLTFQFSVLFCNKNCIISIKFSKAFSKKPTNFKYIHYNWLCDTRITCSLYLWYCSVSSRKMINAPSLCLKIRILICFSVFKEVIFG